MRSVRSTEEWDKTQCWRIGRTKAFFKDARYSLARRDSDKMSLDNANLLEGYDWKALLEQTAHAQDSELTSDPSSLDP
jgi:hypothetical protein